MQDNYNPDFDQSFLDESWEEMRKLLDRDLPVGSTSAAGSTAKSRRSLLLRVAAVLLLCFMVGYGIFINLEHTSNNKTAARQLQDSQQPHIAVTTPARTTPTQPIGQSYSTEEAPAPVNPLLQPSTIGGGLASKQDVQSLPEPSSENDTAKIKQTSTFVLTPLTAAQTKAAATGIENRSVEITASPTEDIAFISDQPLQNDITTNQSANKFHDNKITLPSRAHSKLIGETRSIQERSPLLSQKTGLMAKAQPVRWRVGLMAGAQLEKVDKGFGGFAGGVLLGVDLGKYFGVETGLMYSLTQFNNTVINNTPSQLSFDQSVEDEDGVSGTVIRVPYNEGAVVETDPLQLGRASWLSVPVLLTYHPARAFRVNMGIELARLLHAGENKLFEPKPARTNNVEHYLARHNIAALFGVGWYPVENFGVDLRYNFGFTDLSKNGQRFIDQTDTRTSLQMSVVYYFRTDSLKKTGRL